MTNYFKGFQVLIKKCHFILVLMILFFISGCKEETTKTDKEYNISKAVEADDWSQLFVKNNGWFGGDGIFGIPMDGKEFVPATKNTVTLFTFGDSMIGHHDGASLDPNDFKMINNSIALLQGNEPDTNHISFYWKQTDNGDPQALFVPNTPHAKPGDYYWLGDGFVNTDGDGNLYLFAYPIHEKDTTGTGGFNFEQIGVNVIKIPADGHPPYLNHEQIETPLFDSKTQTTFGSAIYVNTKTAGAPNPDGYIYVYAVSNQTTTKGLLVSRVLPKDFTNFGQWRFWNGNNWGADMNEAKYIAEDVSNEMSVSPLPDGRIVITYQEYTMGSNVVIQIGESLVGPFAKKQVVYRAENKGQASYTTYNAKAYPHLSAPKALLISYNVNSLDFWNDILKDPNFYRPRFIQLSID